MSLSEIKEYICEIGERMYNSGFVAANDGNISVLTKDNDVIVTPTGISKGFMKPEMMVKINKNGTIVEENEYNPSSEYKMHLKVYDKNNEVGAVVHAHPPYATAFAVAGKPLKEKILPEAIVSLGTVPIAKYGTPSTNEVPKSIEKFLKDYNAVLLENHGALTWGENLKEAYYRMETLEFYAQILYHTMAFKNREISKSDIEKLKNEFE